MIQCMYGHWMEIVYHYYENHDAKQLNTLLRYFILLGT